MQALNDSSSLIGDSEALRARAEQDGYLFLPGLLPRTAVEAVRHAFLDIIDAAGWLCADTDKDAAIAEPQAFTVEPETPFMAVFNQQFAVLALHQVQHHPALVAVMENLLGEAVLVHPRSILRNIFPQRDEYTTPAHQDYVHFQGTERCYAAWIPFGDCPVEMGGLTVAEGSHKGGIYDVRPALGAGALEVVENFDRQWRYSPMAMGDVLIHHCMGVHRGVPNRSQSLRLSVDARYQPVSEPVCEDALYPHRKFATWDEIYAGWTDSALKYYWEEMDLEIAPFDFSHYEKRDRVAFEMAERGDHRARGVLQRIFTSDPDPTKRSKAELALTNLEQA